LCYWISKRLESLLLLLNHAKSMYELVDNEDMHFSGYAYLREDPKTKQACWETYDASGENCVRTIPGDPLVLVPENYKVNRTKVEIYEGE
jgi:hypothetical protein